MATSPVTQQPKRTERLQRRYEIARQEGRTNLEDFRPSVVAWLTAAGHARGYLELSHLSPIRFARYRCEMLAEFQTIVSQRAVTLHMFMRRLMRARYKRLEYQGKGFIQPLP